MEPGCGNRTGGLWYKNTGAVTTSPSLLLQDYASTEITGGCRRLHLLVGVRCVRFDKFEHLITAYLLY